MRKGACITNATRGDARESSTALGAPYWRARVVLYIATSTCGDAPTAAARRTWKLWRKALAVALSPLALIRRRRVSPLGVGDCHALACSLS